MNNFLHLVAFYEDFSYVVYSPTLILFVNRKSLFHLKKSFNAINFDGFEKNNFQLVQKHIEVMKKHSHAILKNYNFFVSCGLVR